MDNIIYLNTIKRGQVVRVIRINSTDRALKQRLLDMGITKDVIVTLSKVAPLGDPICLSIRSYALIVRREHLASVEVEVIK